MNLIFCFITMLFISLSSTSDDTEQITLNTFYEYIDSSSPEDGKPSKCDCDYKIIKLQLNKDYTFKLSKQKGRLEIISYEEYKGAWQVETSKILQLEVSSSFKKFNFLPDNPIKEYYNPPYTISLEIKDKELLFEGNKIMCPEGTTFEIEF